MEEIKTPVLLSNKKEKFHALPRKKRIGIVVAAVIALIAIVWGVDWLVYRLTHATTNDAFVEADLINLSPLVPGHVAKLYFDEFDPVQKGDLLATLDDRNYKAALKKAQANFKKAEENYVRYRNLYETRSVSQKVFQRYEAAYKEAQGELEQAEWNVEYCKIFSPVNGYIAKRFVKPGDYAAPGLPVFNVYDPRTIYVLANMGESKLHGVAEGNHVDIWVDAIHHHKLAGTVWQIGTAAAAKFALIPRDVTAGEFTKVIQRLPIKIKVEDWENYKWLRPGLAAEVGIARSKK